MLSSFFRLRPIRSPEQLELAFYHSLTLSLQQGSVFPPRPALPIEIVLLILRLANTVRSDLKVNELEFFAGEWFQDLNYRSLVRSVAAVDARPVGAVCLITPPFNRQTLSRIARAQVLTLSRDQGWVSDPASASWSWFELSIIGPEADGGDKDQRKPPQPKRRADGSNVSWKSHHNQLARVNVAPEYGTVFGPDAEVWRYMEERDRLCVTMWAQFPGWANHAHRGELRIWEYFEPSEESQKLYEEIREAARIRREQEANGTRRPLWPWS